MKMGWKASVVLLILAGVAGCAFVTPNHHLADGWYECEGCGSIITSRNSEITFQISTFKADGCVHKWKESAGTDIDPAPDAIH